MSASGDSTGNIAAAGSRRRRRLRAGLQVLLPVAAAAAVGAFLQRGADLEFWILLLLTAGIALVQLRFQQQTLHRYEARKQFECRVQVRGAVNSGWPGRWNRALATPYPHRLTLQLLDSSSNDTEPLTALRANFTGMRAARAAEALLRFNPRWRVATYSSGGEEILVAAPSSHLTAETGPRPHPRTR